MRKLTAATAAFSAAIFLFVYLLPFEWLLPCAAAMLLAGLIGFFFHGKTRLLIMLISFGLAAGFLWMLAYNALFVAPALTLDGQDCEISAVVTGYTEDGERGYDTAVSVTLPGGKHAKTLLRVYGESPDLAPGDEITFSAHFISAEGLYYRSHSYSLLAFCSGFPTVSGHGGGLRFLPVRCAHAVKENIAAIYPSDAVSFMTALLTGDKELIEADGLLTSSLQNAGMSHVISVSGLHVSFLVGFLALIIRDRRRYLVTSVPIILFFMAFAGFTPSVCRSGIMQLFVVFAALFRRENDSLTALSASLFMLLFINPYAAASKGLQLSYAACLGIVLFSGRMYTYLYEKAKARGLCDDLTGQKAAAYIISGLSSTLGALVFTVPLTALYFGYVSLLAPLSNLLLLWSITIVFCGGYIACALGFIFLPIGSAAATVITILLRFFIRAVAFIASLPIAAVYTENTGIILWLIYVYLMLIAFLALRGKAKQLLYIFSAAAVSLCAVLFISMAATPGELTGELAMTVLNVGQGQSVILTSGDYTAVIDCGSTSGEDAGKLAADHLRNSGRQNVDLLILTHYHADHTNGVSYLASAVDVGAMLIPDPTQTDSEGSEKILSLAEKNDIDVYYVSEDMSIGFGAGTIALYAPLGSENENERCVSVLCTENDFDILITGDAPSSVEKRLIDHTRLPDTEVLVVGHHGSSGSTCEELLAQIRPEAAVISVGQNDYGHPTEKTLSRLEKYGATVFRTDISGTITLSNGTRP